MRKAGKVKGRKGMENKEQEMEGKKAKEKKAKD